MSSSRFVRHLATWRFLLQIALGLLIVVLLLAEARRPSASARASSFTATTLAQGAPVGAAGRTIAGIELVTPEEGWAIVDGRLLWARDSGQQWADITPAKGQAGSIRGGHFLDTSSGWVVVAEPATDGGDQQLKVARTQDTGASWNTNLLAQFRPSDGAPPAGPVYLDFLDRLTGWAVVPLASSSNFRPGRLFRTLDGGATWTEATIPIGEPVRFIDRQTGWTAGGAAGNELYETTDGGQSWEPRVVVAQSSVKSPPMYGLPVFDTPQDGVIPVTLVYDTRPSTTLYTTRDGGQSWRPGMRVPLGDAFGQSSPLPHAINDRTHWIVVDPGTDEVTATSDAGKTKQSARGRSLPARILELSFATPAIGWARAAEGTCEGKKLRNSDGQAVSAPVCTSWSMLLATKDGGATWTELPLPVVPAQ